MNTASKIVKIIVTESTLMAVFAVVVLIFSKKANFAQFEGNHCAFLFILTYNSEILCKFAAEIKTFFVYCKVVKEKEYSSFLNR